jgi:hypothetical protein
MPAVSRRKKASGPSATKFIQDRSFPQAMASNQMAMLRATKVEGMVFDTGWMQNGLWTYFALFYGHATLWTGDGAEAAEVLYAFANHASPTRVWREEQNPDLQCDRAAPVGLVAVSHPGAGRLG